MANDDRDNVCTVCGVLDTHFCGRCKSSRYCSQECQTDDWPLHKLLCKAFSNFDMTTRPSNRHFRGIVFPEDECKPQVAWLKQSNIEPSMGPHKIQTLQLQNDAILLRALPDTIDIICRENFLADGSQLNKSITAVLATFPKQSYRWRGPIVALGKKGRSASAGTCRDLGMNDFRYVANELIAYGGQPLYLRLPTWTLNPKVVKGVRINCVGAQKAFNKPRFEPVDIPVTHSVFNTSPKDSSEIADRIGLPILTQRCPVVGPSARERAQVGSLEQALERDAGILHLCCDATASHCGLPNHKWRGVGSIFVVRRDGKPLAPVHMEALCMYCKEVMYLMSHTYLPVPEPMTRDSALAMIDQARFSTFWDKFLAEKREKGIIVSEPFPHDV